MAEPKSKPEPGLRIAASEGLAAYGFGSSDYVVPGYNDEGRRIRGGNPVVGGQQSLTVAAKRILRHALSNGGAVPVAPLPSVQQKQASSRTLDLPAKGGTDTRICPPGKTKKTKKSKTTQPEDSIRKPRPMTDFDDVPVTIRRDEVEPETGAQPTTNRLPVVFNTAFGKMRMIVQAVMENDTGFGLVFRDEDEVRFVPERGSSISISLPNGTTTNAMYTGCLFAWPDDQRQVMFFIKDNEQPND